VSRVIPLGTPFLRPAAPGDVPAMVELIHGYAAEGLMLPRGVAELRRCLTRYVVLVAPDGGLAGCGGLRVYPGGAAEIVSLAVDVAWRGRGLGAELVERLISDAGDEGITRVFAMTLNAGFFERNGFKTIPRAWLAEKEEAECRSCARRHGCREIAMHRWIEPSAARVGVPAIRIRSPTGGHAPAARAVGDGRSRVPWADATPPGRERMGLPVIDRAGG